MKHRIVPVEPTEKQLAATCTPQPDNARAAYIYATMLSAAPPFKWPEEAVLVAALAVSRILGLNDDPTYAQIAEAALNAALKDVEGRDA